MAASGDLKRRIRGITNTEKITKAMELVAASKMRRSVGAALATRPYAYRAWEVLTNLSAVTDPVLHPLLVRRDVRKGLLVVFSPDRGLTGGLNAQLGRKLLEARQSFGDAPVEAIAYGKKSQEIARRSQLHLVAAFTNPFRQPRLADVLPVARLVLNGYLEGAYDRVVLVWTDYRSAIQQIVQQRVILPIERGEIEESLKETGGRNEFQGLDEMHLREYSFEPSADEVLDVLLKRMIEMQLYQSLLDATASEHAARMMAMRNATEAAGELIDDLTLTYNQVRQANITKDLSEISASRAALETS